MVGFNREGYEIAEEWAYTDALENGLDVSMKQAEEAIGAILYALQNNPMAFDIVYNESVRVAHLNKRTFDGLPAFRVFFRVSEESKTVFLLNIDHG